MNSFHQFWTEMKKEETTSRVITMMEPRADRNENPSNSQLGQ